MAGNIRTAISDLVKASYDPSASYRASMRTLNEVLDGELEELSPINPFVMAIEHQCVLAAAFTETVRADTHRLLQVNALTPEDLYPHMADVHFTTIFNLPSKTIFTLVLNKSEIVNKLVPVPGTLTKKLVISRNSFFTISDFVFGIHYPIEIIQQSHGEMRVLYDTDEPTPLQSLPSNVLNYRTLWNEGVEYLAIDIEVYQFDIISKTPTVTAASSFSTDVEITDGYYATRVYRTLADNSVEEIRVTYSEEIYDVMKPTAVVKLSAGKVNVMIPQIYINSGLINGELRIDIYTTKGLQETSFASYPMGSIGYRFRDLNKKAITTYTAPMKKLGTCHILGEQPVTGGAMAMSFAQLREVVIADAIGDPTLPITPAQIKNYLNRRGYDIVKNTDIVTDRVFLATRDMPAPQTPRLLTSANGSIETITSSFDELSSNSAVIDNGTSITISPKAVYQLTDGLLKMVTDAQLKSINEMRSDLKAAFVTEGNFLYSPYYYVLDKAENQFRLAAYYLDQPSVESQSFFDDNESTMLSVNTKGYDLVKTDTGYKLRVRTKSTDEYKDLVDSSVQCLLGFRSPTETDMCWVLGTLISKDDTRERVFEFDMQTRFSMNEADRIDMRNFRMYDMTARTVYSGLEQDFTLIYATTTQMGPIFERGDMDARIPRYLVEDNCVGITEESFTLKFGTALSNLWARARSIASSLVYETYPTDVILRYEADVYKKDPVTGGEIFFVEGAPQRVLLHRANDPILIDGEEVVRYKAGTIVFDPVTNEPVVKAARYLKHRFELFLVEGVYGFSNDDIAITYRNQLASTISRWVSEDLAEIKKATMDKSQVYLYPKTVFGSIDVTIADGLTIQIPAAQSFSVVLTVSETVNQNEILKTQLKTATIATISNHLKNRTLSHSTLVDEARTEYGDDVIDVQISLFGPMSNIPVLQIVNEIHRCGIRKRLVSRDDERLVVEEAIDISFSTLSN